jgi:hypothetical protein
MNCVQTNLFMPYLCHVNLLTLIMFKTNQPKETKMLEMKTTYQSKNWEKKLSQWCKENREKKSLNILKTAINLIEEKNDLDFVLFFINKSFKKMGVK